MNLNQVVQISVPLKDLICSFCNEVYTFNDSVRKPMLLCKNKHIFCNSCCSKLVKCPACHEDKLEKSSTPGRDRLKGLEEGTKSLREKVPTFSYKEFEKCSQGPRYGSTADVFKFNWGTNVVAMKQLRLQARDSQKEDLLLEASIGVQLKHPNIVQVFGITEIEPNYFGIIMEWADLETLAQQMNEMTEKGKIFASLDICKGLSYLHGKKLAHRDLKPQNILLFGKDGQKLTAKISDFGTSRVIQSIQTNSVIGTLKYAAPELFQQKARCGLSADIFSFVLILFELFSGIDPFPGTVYDIIGAKQLKANPKIPDDFPADLKLVIERCWTNEPMERPSVEDINNVLDKMLPIASNRKSKKITALENIDSLNLALPTSPAQQNSVHHFAPWQYPKTDNVQAPVKVADAVKVRATPEFNVSFFRNFP